jgi:hypothetical protein
VSEEVGLPRWLEVANPVIRVPRRGSVQMI